MNKKELKEQVEDYLAIEGVHDARIALEAVLQYIEQLDEPEIAEEQGFLEHLTRLFKKHGYEHLGQVALALENNFEISINKELPVIPQFVADWIKPLKYSHLGYHIERMEENQEIHNWFIDNREKYGLRDCRDLLAIIKIYGYTIEPPKTLQVIVKNYDSTVFKKELPEDEAMKLIEGWKN